MGVFILSPDIKESFSRLVEYAEQEQHWYIPGKGQTPPGNNPKHVMNVGTIRLVFSWTVMDGLFRHLSISTTSSRDYPDPRIVWTVAHYCGFTGATPDAQGFVFEPSETWQMKPHEEERCVVVVEKIEGPLAA